MQFHQRLTFAVQKYLIHFLKGIFISVLKGNLGLDLRKIRDEDLAQCAKNILDALFHIHEVLNITHCDLRP